MITNNHNVLVDKGGGKVVCDVSIHDSSEVLKLWVLQTTDDRHQDVKDQSGMLKFNIIENFVIERIIESGAYCDQVFLNLLHLEYNVTTAG